MNTDIVSIDRNSLPQALLPAFKRWQRIDFNSDDILLTEILQGAIDQFERNSEITVFATTIMLVPEAADYGCNTTTLRLPVTPINNLQLLSDFVAHSDFSEFSDSTVYEAANVIPFEGYTLQVRGVHGVRLYTLVGPLVDGMGILVDSGYTETTLTPEIRQAIFQLAGHLYEYREILIPGNVGESSMWLNQVMSGFWLPRV